MGCACRGAHRGDCFFAEAGSKDSPGNLEQVNGRGQQEEDSYVVAGIGTVSGHACQNSGRSSRLTIHVVLAKSSQGTGETVLEASKEEEAQPEKQPIRG